MTYLANWHCTGFGPDTLPTKFRTFDEAKRRLIHEIKYQESVAETESRAEDFCALAEDVNLWSSPQSVQAFDGWTYWISEELT